MAGKRRGAKDQDENTQNRHYYRPEDLELRPVVRYAFTRRRGEKNAVYAVYCALGSDEEKPSPRSLTSWLDGRPDEFVEKEIQAWVRRTQGLAEALSAHEPAYYLAHLPRFLRWLARQGVKAGTIRNYRQLLRTYVFPFFLSEGLERPSREWESRYVKFEEFLQRNAKAPSTRNHARVSLNRYLAFLKTEEGFAKLPPSIALETMRGQRKGKDAPLVALPSWADLKVFLDARADAPLRVRWVLALCVAFGVRFSEALGAFPSDIIGRGELAALDEASFARQLKTAEKDVKLLIRIERAVKPPIDDRAMELAGVDSDDTIKTGRRYIAAAMSPCAELVVELAKEVLAKGLRPAVPEDWHKVHADVLKAIRAAEHPAGLHRCTPHDFRRISTTLKAMGMASIESVARVHGHSVDVCRRYQQWGLALRRSSTPGGFDLDVFD